MALNTRSLTLYTLTILTLWSMNLSPSNGFHHQVHVEAPAPAADCMTLELNMADCLSYVSNGSTATKPEQTCCSGLKMVLDVAPECLCEAFKSSSQMGVALNVTKALALPVACKIKAPSAANCGMSLSVGTPAAAPGGLTSSTPGVAPSSSGLNGQSPAQSPNSIVSDSNGISVSVASLIIGLLVASLSAF